MAGATLDAKVENALSRLTGEPGKIVVNPPEDGSKWVWDSTVAINTTDYAGITLDINCQIDVQATGWTLDVGTGGDIAGQLEGRTINILGGTWDASNATDPTGWIRLQEIGGGTTVVPRLVRDYTNSSGNSTAVKMETAAKWSESINVDVGAQTVDIGFDSSTGTDTSFQDNEIKISAGAVQSIGVRLSGDWTSSRIIPDIRLGGDNAVGYVLDGNLRGVTMLDPEVENPGDDNTGTVGWRTTSNFTQAPVIIGGDVNRGGAEIEMLADRNNADLDGLWRIDTDGRHEVRIMDIGRGGIKADLKGDFKVLDDTGSIDWETDANGNIQTAGNWQTGNPANFQGGINIPSDVYARLQRRDLTTATGDANDQLAIHDGTGDMDLGLYRWMDGQTQWVKVRQQTPASGATASRPSSPDVGEMYFDTDLGSNGGRPIWYNGSSWVYADGTVVN